MKQKDQEGSVAVQKIVNWGEASVTIQMKGGIVSMLGLDKKPIVQAQLRHPKEWGEFFDEVKAKIEALGKLSGALSPAAQPQRRSPSSRAPEWLPAPAHLRMLMRGLAMLDAILEPEWESRYYSFDPAWGSEQLGSMRNGEGDWFFVWFAGRERVVIKGFAHESAMTPFKRPDKEPWPGLFDGLPDTLAYARDMQEFPPEEVTFCIWHEEGGAWKTGPVEFPSGEEDPDGSAELLRLLDDEPRSYVRFAAKYYERKVDLRTVHAIYVNRPLTREMISKINPEADAAQVLKEAAEIGYPIATASDAEKETAAPEGKETAAPEGKKTVDTKAKKTAAPKAKTPMR
jgi:hypothetical protein